MNDFLPRKITEINHLVGVDNAPDIHDVIISSNTFLPSTTDGDIVSLYARDLTVDAGATLTVTNRCKGLRIICFGNCDIYGTVSMTARGACAAGEDVTIDISTQTLFTIKFPAEMYAIDRYLKNFFNPVSTFDDLPDSIRPELKRVAVQATTIGTVPAVGASGGNASQTTGKVGIAGTGRKCGGGGSGAGSGNTNKFSGAGGAGTSFSGGCGGGGTSYASSDAYAGSSSGGAGGNATSATATYNCGAGGGAGNPGGSGAKNGTGTFTDGSGGTGGLIILIVMGNLTIHAGGTIESKGSAGGNGYGASAGSGGGGSGGGSINIAYGGVYVNAGTVSAAGGAGGAGTTRAGGAGGAGCITIEQLVI